MQVLQSHGVLLWELPGKQRAAPQALGLNGLCHGHMLQNSPCPEGLSSASEGPEISRMSTDPCVNMQSSSVNPVELLCYVLDGGRGIQRSFLMSACPEGAMSGEDTGVHTK